MDWNKLSSEVLKGKISEENALEILYSPNSDLLNLLQASYQIRNHFLAIRSLYIFFEMLKVEFVQKIVHFALNQQKQ